VTLPIRGRLACDNEEMALLGRCPEAGGFQISDGRHHCSDQRLRPPHIAVLDRIGRPTGQHADRLRRPIRGVLRKGTAAHHGQIRNVPRLQVSVHNAGRWIAAHQGAPDIVRALIRHESEMRALDLASSADKKG
jgi:hypothetical protein